jgi:hypothetical protein
MELQFFFCALHLKNYFWDDAQDFSNILIFMFLLRKFLFVLHRIKTVRTGFTGIHSPYLFGFSTNISRNLWPFYVFNEIETIRRILARKTNILIPNEIKQLLYNNYSESLSINKKNDVFLSQTIFRIVNDTKPEIIFEFGSFFGIDTLYLSKASSEAKIISITENEEMRDFIKKTVFQKKNENISIYSRNEFSIKKYSPVCNGFILFNISEDFERLKNDFDLLLSLIDENCIFAVKSIHDKKAMRDLWIYITNNPRVTSCIDLFSIGIIFLKTDLPKTIYYLKPEKLKI